MVSFFIVFFFPRIVSLSKKLKKCVASKRRTPFLWSALRGGGHPQARGGVGSPDSDATAARAPLAAPRLANRGGRVRGRPPPPPPGAIATPPLGWERHRVGGKGATTATPGPGGPPHPPVGRPDRARAARVVHRRGRGGCSRHARLPPSRLAGRPTGWLGGGCAPDRADRRLLARASAAVIDTDARGGRPPERCRGARALCSGAHTIVPARVVGACRRGRTLPTPQATIRTLVGPLLST